jgi:hypothetical protein
MNTAPVLAAVAVGLLIVFAPDQQPHVLEEQPGTYVTAPTPSANSAAHTVSSSGSTWVWAEGPPSG